MSGVVESKAFLPLSDQPFHEVIEAKGNHSQGTLLHMQHWVSQGLSSPFH